MVELGERGPLWIISAEQSAGKGRLGRIWISKLGNFYGTLLWATGAHQALISQLSFVAALAVYNTASEIEGVDRVSLKWPNDCLLDGAKFCGILCESLGNGSVAIGIGINIAHVPDGLPYEANRLATANVESIFETLQLNISKYLDIWNDGHGFDAIRQLWSAGCGHIGRPISVDGIKGIFEGLAHNGALVLRSASGEEKHIYAGDVRVEYQ